jgi:hypothetical protein
MIRGDWPQLHGRHVWVFLEILSCIYTSRLWIWDHMGVGRSVVVQLQAQPYIWYERSHFLRHKTAVFVFKKDSSALCIRFFGFKNVRGCGYRLSRTLSQIWDFVIEHTGQCPHTVVLRSFSAGTHSSSLVRFLDIQVLRSNNSRYEYLLPGIFI